MPGLVGLVTMMPRHCAEAELKSMLRAMCHESFYQTGMWIDESAGVYLGWTARPGAAPDGKPMCNPRTGVVLAFSGDDFPAPGTTALPGRPAEGHATGGASRAYLLALHEEDRSFPAGLNGRFHGLVVDRNRKTTTLFNDRFGMHRLYYHESKDAFYFAAEAKAILAVRAETRSGDPRGLGELVSCGCVLENRTLFKGIHVLPSGSAWVFRGDTAPDRRQYFEPREWEEQPPLEPESYYRELRDVFSQNLPRYFDTPDRLGFSLTGGLDTRMILASHNPPSGTLPCYTFGGTFRDCRDVVVARQVAQACGQPHEVIRVGDEFLANFADYASRTVYLTDGCADVSRSADLYVNTKAREIAPVRMTGNYGGEVLRRVRAFKPVEPLAGLFQPGFTAHVDRARETYGGLLHDHPLSFAVFRQAPWHHYGLLALEQTQLSLRSPYLDNDFVRTVFRAPTIASTSDDVCLRLIADGNASLSAIPTDRGINGTGGRLLPSHGLQQFAFKAEYAYDYGMPQWLAQVNHLLRPLHLERRFLGRHKFYHYRVWYRDALSKWVRSVLLDRSALARPYLQPNTVERIVDGHVKGNRNYTTSIHKLLTLELVHRLLLGEK